MGSALGLALIVAGSMLLLYGVEQILRAARALIVKVEFAEFIYGLTVAALVTTAPEIAINTLYAYRGAGDLVIANIIGSNLFNVLLVLGLAGTTGAVRVGRRIYRRTLPLLLLSSGVVYALSSDLVIDRTDGIILSLAAVGYLLFVFETTHGWGDLPPIEAEPLRLRQTVVLATVGGAATLVGAYVVVRGGQALDDGASAFAQTLSDNPSLLGISILAVSTSLPEFALGVGAVIHGRKELLAGAVLGSCIFNVTLGLGSAAMIGGEVSAQDSALSPALLLSVLSVAGCLGLLVLRPPLSRGLGALYVASYFAFLLWLALYTVGSASAQVVYTVAAAACLAPLAFAAFTLVKEIMASEGKLDTDEE